MLINCTSYGIQSVHIGIILLKINLFLFEVYIVMVVKVHRVKECSACCGKCKQYKETDELFGLVGEYLSLVRDITELSLLISLLKDNKDANKPISTVGADFCQNKWVDDLCNYMMSTGKHNKNTKENKSKLVKVRKVTQRNTK